MHWPREQFDGWWKGIEPELSAHPLAQMILPSLQAMRDAIDRSRVQRSMLVAGLAVLQQGPEQLTRYRDPSSSGVFAYVTRPTGFELQSTYRSKGKPLRMEFATLPPQ
jgi:hypothetical protein